MRSAVMEDGDGVVARSRTLRRRIRSGDQPLEKNGLFSNLIMMEKCEEIYVGSNSRVTSSAAFINPIKGLNPITIGFEVVCKSGGPTVQACNEGNQRCEISTSRPGKLKRGAQTKELFDAATMQLRSEIDFLNNKQFEILMCYDVRSLGQILDLTLRQLMSIEMSKKQMDKLLRLVKDLLHTKKIERALIEEEKCLKNDVFANSFKKDENTNGPNDNDDDEVVLVIDETPPEKEASSNNEIETQSKLSQEQKIVPQNYRIPRSVDEITKDLSVVQNTKIPTFVTAVTEIRGELSQMIDDLKANEEMVKKSLTLPTKDKAIQEAPPSGLSDKKEYIKSNRRNSKDKVIKSRNLFKNKKNSIKAIKDKDYLPPARGKALKQKVINKESINQLKNGQKGKSKQCRGKDNCKNIGSEIQEQFVKMGDAKIVIDAENMPVDLTAKNNTELKDNDADNVKMIKKSFGMDGTKKLVEKENVKKSINSISKTTGGHTLEMNTKINLVLDDENRSNQSVMLSKCILEGLTNTRQKESKDEKQLVSDIRPLSPKDTSVNLSLPSSSKLNATNLDKPNLKAEERLRFKRLAVTVAKLKVPNVTTSKMLDCSSTSTTRYIPLKCSNENKIDADSTTSLSAESKSSTERKRSVDSDEISYKSESGEENKKENDLNNENVTHKKIKIDKTLLEKNADNEKVERAQTSSPLSPICEKTKTLSQHKHDFIQNNLKPNKDEGRKLSLPAPLSPIISDSTVQQKERIVRYRTEISSKMCEGSKESKKSSINSTSKCTSSSDKGKNLIPTAPLSPDILNSAVQQMEMDIRCKIEKSLKNCEQTKKKDFSVLTISPVETSKNSNEDILKQPNLVITCEQNTAKRHIVFENESVNDEEVDKSIASPLFSPIKSQGNKIDLNSYACVGEINASLTFPEMPYLLHEIDMPQIIVNKPDKLDSVLLSNTEDIRLEKFRKKSSECKISLLSPVKQQQQQPEQQTMSGEHLQQQYDPRNENNFYHTASPFRHEVYHQSALMTKQEQQPQQTPNMILYGCLQRSPWYQSLMSTMKIQINQSISVLVHAINNFQKERFENPNAVFDIFKLYCAGELLEILKNLGLFVDANGIITEHKNAPTFGGYPPAYSYIQQVMSPVPTEVNVSASPANVVASTTSSPYSTSPFINCYVHSPYQYKSQNSFKSSRQSNFSISSPLRTNSTYDNEEECWDSEETNSNHTNHTFYNEKSRDYDYNRNRARHRYTERTSDKRYEQRSNKYGYRNHY